MHLKCILSRNTAINQIKTRRREEKDKIITKIEEGRIQLGLDMIVKTSTGEVASEKTTPIMTLYQMVNIIPSSLSGLKKQTKAI